jgi:LysM repeat protein
MTSYGAIGSWGPQVEVPVRLGHLTRRGRVVRALIVLALVAMAALWLTSRLAVSPASAGSAAGVPAVPVVQVTVEEGDSLWAIARATVPEADPREVILDIRELNGLATNTIHPGQVLSVPQR